MQLLKLKYLGATLFNKILTGICKPANPEAAFMFLGADWLDCKSRDKEDHPKMLSTMCILMHVNVYQVFELLKQEDISFFGV